jgi:uncharacterized membrane protein
LASAPSAQARLVTHDVLRTVVIVVIIVLMIAQPLLAMFGIRISF